MLRAEFFNRESGSPSSPSHSLHTESLEDSDELRDYFSHLELAGEENQGVAGDRESPQGQAAPLAAAQNAGIAIINPLHAFYLNMDAQYGQQFAWAHDGQYPPPAWGHAGQFIPPPPPYVPPQGAGNLPRLLEVPPSLLLPFLLPSLRRHRRPSSPLLSGPRT